MDRGSISWRPFLGPHLSSAHPSAILGGTPPAHPAGNRGNQRRSSGPSLEEVRRTAPGRSEYYLMKRYTRSNGVCWNLSEPLSVRNKDPFGRRGGLLQGSLIEVSLALVGVASPA